MSFLTNFRGLEPKYKSTPVYWGPVGIWVSYKRTFYINYEHNATYGRRLKFYWQNSKVVLAMC